MCNVHFADPIQVGRMMAAQVRDTLYTYVPPDWANKLCNIPLHRLQVKYC